MDEYIKQWDEAVERCLDLCDEEGLLELLARAEREIGEPLPDEEPVL